MWRPWLPSQPTTTAILALQSHVERAGYALACSYSSSAELEAAVIRSRLDAGIYGAKRRRRLVACGFAAAIGTLLAILLLLA